jgi:hypothetical protein
MGRKAWRIVAKALGEKASSYDREADMVALVRLLILAGYMVTNTVICAGVVRHWNDNEPTTTRIQLQARPSASQRY